MKALRAMQRDRRRAQRGSVLSAVLIMTAFLAIISAAIMTELSTNLLVSRAFVHRVTNAATVNSAVELTIDHLQATAIGQPCPLPSSTTLNSVTASAVYGICQMAADPSSPAPVTGTGSSPFTIDGTHVVVGSPWNVNEYLVGDSSSLYEANFGSSASNWTYNVGAALTGPPNAVPDSLSGPPQLLDLVPTTAQCGSSPYCVQVLAESAGSAPNYQCSLPSGDVVTARPMAGINNPKDGFFGDASGILYAYDMGGSGDSDCNLLDSITVPDGSPIVAGPFVFPGPSGTDEVYVVASDGTQAEVVRYAFQPSSGFSSLATRDLPYAGVQGVALDGGALPVRLAIAYSGGQVTLAQISATYNISLPGGAAALPTGITAAPHWCQCAGGTLIGVGGQNGTLYVLDTNLNIQASFAGPSPITTSPTADTAGDWFFGAGDHHLYWVSPGMVQQAAYSLDGPVGSSAVAGACPDGICVYVATHGRHAYLIDFDSRNVVMTACITTSPPTCSGDNPRLWVKVKVGAAGAPRAVHVLGWSYYSP